MNSIVSVYCILAHRQKKWWSIKERRPCSKQLNSQYEDWLRMDWWFQLIDPTRRIQISCDVSEHSSRVLVNGVGSLLRFFQSCFFSKVKEIAQKAKRSDEADQIDANKDARSAKDDWALRGDPVRRRLLQDQFRARAQVKTCARLRPGQSPLSSPPGRSATETADTCRKADGR